MAPYLPTYERCENCHNRGEDATGGCLSCGRYVRLSSASYSPVTISIPERHGARERTRRLKQAKRTNG
jgi:predicted ATP-dependent serine protease